ncbi:cohesin domain-containing protein, partial [Acetivibrio straminisolvens]
MKHKKILSFLLTLLLLISTISVNMSYAETTPSIEMVLNKTTANVGDIITATIKINNVRYLAGYQLNIKYDPEVLQPVNPKTGAEFTERTMPVNGNLLMNEEYGPTNMVANNIKSGILNFGCVYTYANDYKAVGIDEHTGIIGEIGFKVLKSKNTSIKFEDTLTMPDAISGTNLFNWDSEIITGYSVIQPDPIIIEAEPLKDAYVSMELDKTKVKVGDIITGTIKIENMKNFGGYQLNIKYDPTVLEAVDLATGGAIETRTWPVTGETVLLNEEYGPTRIVMNNKSAGIVNFGSTYTYL